MIVIADTSPINYLVLIGAIDVLAALYDTVVIPQAVFEELQAPATPQTVQTWIMNAPGWLRVEQITEAQRPEARLLDKGELEAIILAESLKADALIIDDRVGREEARSRGIFVIGTLGVINAAARKGLLDLPTALDQLRETSFRASESLITQLIEADAERSVDH